MSRMNDLIDTYYSPQVFVQRKRGYRSLMIGMVCGALAVGCSMLTFLSLIALFTTGRLWLLLIVIIIALFTTCLYIAGLFGVILGVILIFTSQYKMEQQMAATTAQHQ